MKSTTPKPLSLLPPTSSVIQVHIKCSYFIIHNVHNILKDHGSTLDPKNYGWLYDDGILLPEKGLNPLPAEILTLCKNVLVGVTPDVVLAGKLDFIVCYIVTSHQTPPAKITRMFCEMLLCHFS